MSTSVPVSAAEFLARFHATEPAALNYRAPTDLFNELELDALATQFAPEPTAAIDAVPALPSREPAGAISYETKNAPVVEVHPGRLGPVQRVEC